jgi:hypothetical protein
MNYPALGRKPNSNIQSLIHKGKENQNDTKQTGDASIHEALRLKRLDHPKRNALTDSITRIQTTSRIRPKQYQVKHLPAAAPPSFVSASQAKRSAPRDLFLLTAPTKGDLTSLISHSP